jgi:hypothetical protein
VWSKRMSLVRGSDELQLRSRATNSIQGKKFSMWQKQWVVIHGHVTTIPVKNSGMSSYCYSNEKLWYGEGYSSEKVRYVELLLLQ